ncbi:hypothetical protein [Bremerella cremea]|nr:hypothetical protein [Bremerella cremea]
MIAPSPFSALFDSMQLDRCAPGELPKFDLVARGTLPRKRHGVSWSLFHSLRQADEELTPVNITLGTARWTIVLYRTEKELCQRWDDFDRREAETDQGVIFGLSAEFNGHLPALIRRDTLGQLLVLWHLPGCPATVRRFMPEDLPAEELGWSQIQVVKKLTALPQQSAAEKSDAQSWLVFWPYELATDQIQHYAVPSRMM